MTTTLTARLEELIRTLYPEPCECENGSGLVCGGCLGREELRMLVSGVLEVAAKACESYNAVDAGYACAANIRALFSDLEAKE